MLWILITTWRAIVKCRALRTIFLTGDADKQQQQQKKVLTSKRKCCKGAARELTSKKKSQLLTSIIPFLLSGGFMRVGGGGQQARAPSEFWTTVILVPFCIRMFKNKAHIMFTAAFKTWNIILVSHNIPRTEICWIFPLVRRELRNIKEGYASQLRLSP